jgi:hypothetical protein
MEVVDGFFGLFEAAEFAESAAAKVVGCHKSVFKLGWTVKIAQAASSQIPHSEVEGHSQGAV